MKLVNQSDLLDKEWVLVSHHSEQKDACGKKPIHSKCVIVNVVWYVMMYAAKGLPVVENYLLPLLALQPTRGLRSCPGRDR
ncbi:hypothetical protein [Nitrosomonas communis]|uniref:Uncharacterized protein n=1 Tax=Nitrosomonas communis TaxID=44574 RepID=A0A1I4NZH8_9PROT|nr:hypothetical protein [Nitrosomonas communis]SFM20951.1 hypothetical protein SAMN05421863_101737 [Nitrosomonas communis]